MLDDEVTALALQLEELGAYPPCGSDRCDDRNATNSDIAFAQYQTEVKNRYTFLTDQQLARSIGAAEHSDGAMISTLASNEVQCYNDRQLALDITEDDADADSNLEYDEENQYAASMTELSNDDHNRSGLSKSYFESQSSVLEKLQRKYTCVCCLDEHYSHRTILLPCNDRYCIDCLRNLFVRASTDESLFPVRCHRETIPLELVVNHLSQEELSNFERASIEYTTMDRVYCSNINCGKFILPDKIESGTRKAICDTCYQTTCGLCKSGYHEGSDCPDDPELRATRHMAQGLGWQTCYSCKSIIDLRSGCNHITCRCGAEFCYVCATQWKNCNCDHADEDHLLERAEEIVDRDAYLVLDHDERQLRIQHMVADLQQNHECDHSRRFRRVEGSPGRGYRCEMCNARHWQFILECRRCHLRVCQDCRCNRI
ncbi:hypothetical protein DM02DRAFT_688579 [Periconia macrospinosa]|uniref:RBR-type E3 ubiquitin transferase n=1 Tax=Periconia macrospinosa TaxID=97972 RepID=A0A2V1DDB7_9PLEO|nr:hypothetical protein DM02DRAFT_688579 [Periconia macrospinosa]